MAGCCVVLGWLLSPLVVALPLQPSSRATEAMMLMVLSIFILMYSFQPAKLRKKTHTMPMPPMATSSKNQDFDAVVLHAPSPFSFFKKIMKLLGLAICLQSRGEGL
jgi:hypothetical protein